MTGLTLSQMYYETYGKPMIHQQFPSYESRIAVGLVGEGSECFGFDDSYSQDHDFGPGFCIWLTKEDFDKIGVQLQQEYEKLPSKFQGYVARRDNPMGGHRIGVWETGEFYRHFIGSEKAPKDWHRWLYLPDHYFAVAVNGAVFRDDLGEFSLVREELLKGYPEDVRIKKIVARAAIMSQSGQYNYLRCIIRGEAVAAQLALAEFIKNGMSMVYLLNRKYTPFYKWMYRGLQSLDVLSGTASLFNKLASGNLDAQSRQAVIEEICDLVVQEWKRQGLTDMSDGFLQNHLDTLMNKIQNEEIRKLHWLDGADM